MSPHQSPGTTSVALDLAGVRWLVDLSAYGDETGSALAGMVVHLWWRSCVVPGGDEPVVQVVPGDWAYAVPPGVERIVAPTDRAAFPYAFSRALTRLTILRRAGSAVLLHAAGVASADGDRAVVLAAPSGTGKSTAARTLGRHFGYLSDELVVIEPDLRLSSYPKPISVVAGDRPGDKDEWAPDELGLAPTPARGPGLAAVLLLRRDVAVAAPMLRRLGLVDALLDLVQQSSSVWLLDRPLERLAQAAVRGGGPFELRYSEIASCRDVVADVLDPRHGEDAERRIVQEYLTHPPTDDTAWHPTRHDASPTCAEADAADRFVRAPWSDAVEVDGEVLLLLGPQPVRLTGLGASVWLAASEAATLEELVEAAVRAHGPHPDASSLVGEFVREAVANNVLLRVEPVAVVMP
ncbi:hypothetical protein ACWEOW_06590 [Monashia sp. NPDC004114]